MNPSGRSMSPELQPSARRPTVTNSSVRPMDLEWRLIKCSRQLVARMGNQMENTRLNHSSWRLALADTYFR